jgi:predicted RNA binding protein YcfA (HicA-like mRNA interferase family)
VSPSARRKRREFDAMMGRRCRGVSFDELCALLEMHGWELRSSEGSHFIYVHLHYEGIVSLPRPHHGSEVKRHYCREALRAIGEVEGYE